MNKVVNESRARAVQYLTNTQNGDEAILALAAVLLYFADVAASDVRTVELEP